MLMELEVAGGGEVEPVRARRQEHIRVGEIPAGDVAGVGLGRVGQVPVVLKLENGLLLGGDLHIA